MNGNLTGNAHGLKGDQVDVCKTILEVITHALKSEECRLRSRSERPGVPLWPWTVRGGFNEDWIRYLLVRELSDRCPEQDLEIEAEVGGVPHVDLSICGFASVELKGPHLVKENFDKRVYNAILDDFSKQRRRAKKEPKPQHFVLLIVHGSKSKFDSGFVQEWLDTLKSDVTDSCVCIKLEESESLDLNNGNEPPWQMKCCLYEVC